MISIQDMTDLILVRQIYNLSLMKRFQLMRVIAVFCRLAQLGLVQALKCSFKHRLLRLTEKPVPL